MAPKKTPDNKPRVAAETHRALWDLIKQNFLQPIGMFVMTGIKPKRGQIKKDAEVEVWTDVVKTAFAAGVDSGYAMAHDVFVVQAAELEAAVEAWSTWYSADVVGACDGPGSSKIDPENEHDWESIAIGFLVAKGVDVHAPVFADNGLAAFCSYLSSNDTAGAMDWYARASAAISGKEQQP